MISQNTPEPQATIIHTPEGAWRCSACGGFVRQDARMCKHCDRSFGRGGPETPPTGGRVLLSLLGVGLITGLCLLGGMMLGVYLWPPQRFAMFGPPSAWLGGLAGMAIGSIFALMFLGSVLRSR